MANKSREVYLPLGTAKEISLPPKATLRYVTFVTYNLSRTFACVYAPTYMDSVWHVSLSKNKWCMKTDNMKQFDEETDALLTDASRWASASQGLFAEHVYLWAYMAIASIVGTDRNEIHRRFHESPSDCIFLKMYDRWNNRFLTTSLSKLCAYAKGVPPLFVTALKTRDHQSSFAFVSRNCEQKLPSRVCNCFKRMHGICFMVPVIKYLVARNSPTQQSVSDKYYKFVREEAMSLIGKLCCLYMPRRHDVLHSDATYEQLDVVFVMDVQWSPDEFKVPDAYTVFSTSQRCCININLRCGIRPVFVKLDSLIPGNNERVVDYEIHKSTHGCLEWMGRMSCLTMLPNRELSNLVKIHADDMFHHCFDVFLKVPYESTKEDETMIALQVIFLKIFQSCLLHFLRVFSPDSPIHMKKELTVIILGTRKKPRHVL